MPVLAELAYLNAGTDGPLPARSVQAALLELERAAREGRAREYFERRAVLADSLRRAYAAVLGCAPEELSLTSCTSEGIAIVLEGLDLGPDQEVLTSDEEHPGLLGALGAARELRGISVRMVSLEEISGAVGPRTALVACSHVGWTSGRIAPAALAELEVPVLLDGAQAAGAIPVDVLALGCSAYAGPGQKWLCGPDGTGMLYVRPDLRERLRTSRRGYVNLADPGAGLEASLHADGRRFDTMSLNAETLAGALASVEFLEGFGWPELHRRASALAEVLVRRLSELGREVAPRGASTLVSFTSPDPPAERAHLAERGVIVREIPESPWLRASVGAWNNQTDLERLLEALVP